MQFMKNYLFITFLLLFLLSCETKTHTEGPFLGSEPLEHQEGIPMDSIKAIIETEINSDEYRIFDSTIKVDSIAHSLLNEDENQAIQPFYNIILDTGMNYYPLDSMMYQASKLLSYKIDTMGRLYNDSLNRLMLPFNDEDELYAGEYFPRRFEGNYLSIEYSSGYIEHSSENSLCLISAICKEKYQADSLLNETQKHFPKAFISLHNMYLGCMH